MTRSLRALHRRAFPVIAAVVPAVLIAGLMGRAPQPGETASPAPLAATLEFESETLWRTALIITRIYSSEDAEPRFYIELESPAPLATPDLLLYWSSKPSQGTLPASAILLGPYSGGVKRFALPAEKDPRSGMLALYSLARQSVFATAEAPSSER